jgi:hypothetical protein
MAASRPSPPFGRLCCDYVVAEVGGTAHAKDLPHGLDVQRRLDEACFPAHPLDSAKHISPYAQENEVPMQAISQPGEIGARPVQSLPIRRAHEPGSPVTVPAFVMPPLPGVQPSPRG